MSQGHKGVGKGPSSTRGSVTEKEGAAPMWKGWVSVQVTLHVSQVKTAPDCHYPRQPPSSVSLVPEAAMPRGHKERLGPRGPCRLKAGLGEGQVGTRQAGRPLPSVLALPAGSP